MREGSGFADFSGRDGLVKNPPQVLDLLPRAVGRVLQIWYKAGWVFGGIANQDQEDQGVSSVELGGDEGERCPYSHLISAMCEYGVSMSSLLTTRPLRESVRPRSTIFSKASSRMISSYVASSGLRLDDFRHFSFALDMSGSG